MGERRKVIGGPSRRPGAGRKSNADSRRHKISVQSQRGAIEELSEFEEKPRIHKHHKHQKKEHDRGKEIKQLKKTVTEKEEALTQLKDEINELKAAQKEVDGKIARMKVEVPCVKMLAYGYDAVDEGKDSLS